MAGRRRRPFSLVRLRTIAPMVVVSGGCECPTKNTRAYIIIIIIIVVVVVVDIVVVSYDAHFTDSAAAAAALSLTLSQ